MSFKDDYVESIRKGCEAHHKQFFPKDAMDEFERTAKEDIKNGANVCVNHKERPTMQKLYPLGKWCCADCAAALFDLGYLGSGALVFDMTPIGENQ